MSDECEELQFGIPRWGHKNNPFEEYLHMTGDDNPKQKHFRMAAIHTHDDLFAARAIALSIYGRTWKDYVLDIYDRLRANQKIGEP